MHVNRTWCDVSVLWEATLPIALYVVNACSTNSFNWPNTPIKTIGRTLFITLLWIITQSRTSIFNNIISGLAVRLTHRLTPAIPVIDWVSYFRRSPSCVHIWTSLGHSGFGQSTESQAEERLRVLLYTEERLCALKLCPQAGTVQWTQVLWCTVLVKLDCFTGSKFKETPGLEFFVHVPIS